MSKANLEIQEGVIFFLMCYAEFDLKSIMFFINVLFFFLPWLVNKEEKSIKKNILITKYTKLYILMYQSVRVGKILNKKESL